MNPAPAERPSSEKNPSTAPSDEKKTPLARAVGAIKLLPGIGNPLAYLIEHWGLRETVFGVIGWLVGWTLVYFGLAPKLLLRRSLEASPGATTPRARLERVALHLLEDLPDWLQPYSRWLEEEADDLVANQRIAGYRSCNLHAAGFEPSAGFRWQLKAAPGFEMSGWAFRHTREDLFQRLEPEKLDAATLRFAVPALDEGDELLTVLTVRGPQSMDMETCQDLVRSEVE